MNDPITTRYLELSNTQNIPDLAAYAVSWQKLAADARAAGRVASADAYQKRGDWYAEQGKGEHVRLIEGSFSQLIPVTPSEAVEILDAVLGVG